MKSIIKRILISIVVAVFSGFMLATPAFAVCPDGCVPTAILGNATGTEGENCSCDNGSGDSVTGILQLVVNILSVGIGVLAVIGIVVVGIQYLTAGGNEEQTRKAKRRLLEIVIGIAAYILIYALLRWLLPGFSG